MKAYNDYIEVLKQHKLSPENSDGLTDTIMQEIEIMQLQKKPLVIIQILQPVTKIAAVFLVALFVYQTYFSDTELKQSGKIVPVSTIYPSDLPGENPLQIILAISKTTQINRANKQALMAFISIHKK